MKKTTIDNVYEKVADELNLSSKEIKDIYTQYWETIRNIISSLDISKETTEEYFKQNKTNFNLTGLGKLSCTYSDIVKYNNKKKKQYDKIKKRNTEIQQSHNNDEEIH